MSPISPPKDPSQLASLAFKRPALVRLLAEAERYEPRFHNHLLFLEAPRSTNYDRVMTEHAGDPSGVEYRNRSGFDQWAFVLPDVSSRDQKGWRVQFFDRDGFQSHHCEPELHLAVDVMVSRGFLIPARGVLDELSTTPRWKRGVEVSALMFKLNSKAISYLEFVERVSALDPI